MPRKLDLTGQKFGEFTAILISGYRDTTGRICWDCICSCGSITTVRVGYLTAGRTKRCMACKIKELVSLNKRRKGRKGK